MLWTIYCKDVFLCITNIWTRLKIIGRNEPLVTLHQQIFIFEHHSCRVQILLHQISIRYAAPSNSLWRSHSSTFMVFPSSFWMLRSIRCEAVLMCLSRRVWKEGAASCGETVMAFKGLGPSQTQREGRFYRKAYCKNQLRLHTSDKAAGMNCLIFGRLDVGVKHNWGP